MSATPSPTGHAVEAEHQVIKKLLATIEGQPDLSQVREVVARFCTMLPQHFKEEEAPTASTRTCERFAPAWPTPFEP